MGQQSGYEEGARLVVRNESAWKEFWERHAGLGEESERPAVDFSREMVVAAMLGARGNTCWNVRVTGVTDEGTRTLVEVTTYEPLPGAFCGMAITYPHHVVAFARSEDRVEFVERSQMGPPPA